MKDHLEMWSVSSIWPLKDYLLIGPHLASTHQRQKHNSQPDPKEQPAGMTLSCDIISQKITLNRHLTVWERKLSYNLYSCLLFCIFSVNYIGHLCLDSLSCHFSLLIFFPWSLLLLFFLRGIHISCPDVQVLCISASRDCLSLTPSSCLLHPWKLTINLLHVPTIPCFLPSFASINPILTLDILIFYSPSTHSHSNWYTSIQYYHHS